MNGSAFGRSLGLEAVAALLLSLAVGSASAVAQPGVFISAGDMIKQRSAPTATLLRDGRVLISGGLNQSVFPFVVEASAELYDPAASFIPTASMTVARRFHSATLLQDGRVLIAGGNSNPDGSGPAIASAELYDPATGVFTRTGDMTVARRGHDAVLLADGTVFIAGFEGGGTAELYDPSARTFTAVGSMLYSSFSVTATLLSNGKVLITHGSYSDRRAEIYDPSTGTFSATGERTYPRFGHFATLLRNGDVLITGGINESDEPALTAELYHPESGVFTAIGDMRLSTLTATLLSDGKVLITGFPPGGFGIDQQTKADLYDPVTNTFTATGSMAAHREGHRATLLNTGDVLITGSVNLFPNPPLQNAELYRASGPGAPSTWTPTDIGNVGISGSAAEENGIWTVRGAGGDVWGPADAFHFVSRRVLDEAQTIVVRVDDMQNTNPFAKAGLMLRTSLEPNAAMVILNVKPNGEIEFMHRPSFGADVIYVGGTFVNGPVWLRLEWGQKIGSFTLVVPAVSRDNLHWSVLFAPGVALPANGSFDAGIAVTSHDTGQLNTAHFAGLSQLASGLFSHDVGSTGFVGSAQQDSLSNTRPITIKAAGADVWGTADSFQFVHAGSYVSTNSGMFTIRVVSLENTNPFAKAGLMVREGSTNSSVDFDLPPNAPSVILNAKPNGELEFMARQCAACPTIYLGGAQLSLPGYISIVKNGSTFTAGFGQDPDALESIGSVEVFMSEWIPGLAVTSHDVSRTTTAVFENLSFLVQ